MDCITNRLTYRETGYFSSLVADYLDGNDFLRSYYAQPPSLEGIRKSIVARGSFPSNRPLLVDTLKEQYQGIAMSPGVSANIESLSGAHCFTVSSAHQPAIFTGTLFFIYKILHSIKLAETLREALPEFQFVPVYYMGSEDADLEELGHIYLDGQKIEWETKQTGAVGRMKTRGLEKIIDRIEGEFSDQPHGAELVRLLRTCYLESGNVQTATFRLLNELFGSYGLVVLIPDHPNFKRAMVSVFRDDLFEGIPASITIRTIEALEHHYPVQAKPREINLFYLDDGIRERIEEKDEHFAVHHTDLVFSREKLESLLEAHPERFSPNVILRGLFQETILPNIAFIGGGGETAYWLELKPIFDHYKVPYPVLLLRNSFLFIQKKWQRKMAKAGLNWKTVFQKEEYLFETAVKDHSSKQLDLQQELTQLKKKYDQIREVSMAVDASLGPHVEALRTKALRRLEELEKKILKAEKKNYEDLRKGIHQVRSALFPLGSLQERIENFIPYYAAYGKEFIQMVYRHSLTLEQEFVVLEEQ
jgi:bacillithiol synthase